LYAGACVGPREYPLRPPRSSACAVNETAESSVAAAIPIMRRFMVFLLSWRDTSSREKEDAACRRRVDEMM
jgi:hypothetical protein